MHSDPAPRKWTIYLINGLTQNTRHWNPQLLASLRDREWVDDVIGLDLPGAGDLAHEPAPTQIAHYVPLMRRFYADHFVAEKPRLLVALSLGGMVASEWCHQFPDDFQKLVLVNTSFGKFAAFYKRLQPAAWYTIASVFFRRGRAAREQRTLNLVSNDPEKRSTILPLWVDARRERPTAPINALRQLLAAKRYIAPQRLPHDTVVICSRYDRLCHYTASETIARHYGVSLVIEPNPAIGHAFHVDGADELMAIIENCAVKQCKVREEPVAPEIH